MAWTLVKKKLPLPAASAALTSLMRASFAIVFWSMICHSEAADEELRGGGEKPPRVRARRLKREENIGDRCHLLLFTTRYKTRRPFLLHLKHW